SARLAGWFEGRAAICVITLVIVRVGVAVWMIGCATPQEWAEWKGHPVHFASGDHMGFSVRNRDGPQTRVTRDDVALARSQDWFGTAITVDQSAIVEK